MKRVLLLAASLSAVVGSYSQTLTSSDLPIIVLNTSGQTIMDEPKIIIDMGIINNGAGVRNNITDAFNDYEGKIGIEIRGKSSQMFPMKSYSIELTDDAGESQDKSLFGLPKESDWVLYAPYNEKTLMHNFLAYTLSREMGHWAANCRYVELVIDGDYKGIYVFMEKIKRNSARVSVPKMSENDIAGDALTGGYLFSIDKDADAWYSSYGTEHSIAGQRIQFSYIYPKADDIVQQQKDYIKSYVDSFENVLHGPDYQDKVNGWRRYADEASFIDYFIVNEVSRNVDGYRLSTFFYKDRQSKGGKIVAGPVWDYDLSFRNADYCEGSSVTGWSYAFNSVCPQDFWQVPFWWDRFAADSAFQANLRCRWKELRETTLSVGHLNFLIDSIVALTTEARTRHFQRWPVLGQYVWPNPQPIPSTYDEEIAVLKQWVSSRLDWIDGAIPNTGACFDPINNGGAQFIVQFAPNPFRGELNLTFQSNSNQVVRMGAYDVLGRTKLLNAFHVMPGMSYFTVKTNAWSSGVYFFKVEAQSGERASFKLLRE